MVGSGPEGEGACLNYFNILLGLKGGEGAMNNIVNDPLRRNSINKLAYT